MSEFLLRACHDLRAPLRAMRAHTELLLRDSESLLPSSFGERLGLVVDAAHRIDLLAAALSQYSLALRIEENAFQSTPMESLLRLVLAKLNQEVRDYDAAVTYDPLPRVSGDPEPLSQVLENLLLNALRHRGTLPPRVHVTAARRSDGWIFAVNDNGPGIEAAYLERIFKPFERLQRGDYLGAGLGLTICRVILQKHGGRIWAESNLGVGSTFFFTLPFAEPDRKPPST